MFRKQTRGLVAALTLVLIGSAIAFARNNPTVTKVLAGATASLITTQDSQQVASSRPLVKIFLSGTVDRNHESVSVEKVGTVRPGEVVNFTVNSVNEGSAPARQYRAIGQIPSGTIFVSGSALAQNTTQVSYSIDDGQNFSTQPMIEEKQSDGTLKKVAAPLSMYTQVRFEWADSLAAGGKLAASYQVRVN